MIGTLNLVTYLLAETSHRELNVDCQKVWSNDSSAINGTTEALKTNIHQEIWRIPLEMCANIITNFNVRVAAVIQRRGAWTEHVQQGNVLCGGHQRLAPVLGVHLHGR
ncbi:hypothetical protein E2C01_016639 [Portunus trituberculatus]|uniref:Uncharacterized protein n=1 Tax=Portunus trituberculatus TaxID=210409 RepID=A0A5B7DPK3_PORTR|nr:hypothetical protein [Portunus trituberculatus]